MSTTSELRLPADPAFIVVAKRAAAGFASVAGFDLDSCDDVVIAVAQACQNAIAWCRRAGAAGEGQLRLIFTLEGGRLEVQLRSIAPARPAIGGTAAAGRPLLAADRALEAADLDLMGELVTTELALRVIGLFVDECRYRVDARTGGLRVRLTKYCGS